MPDSRVSRTVSPLPGLDDGVMRAPQSVLMGRDPEALAILLGIHALADPTILDVTYNTGKMWKGCSFQPHTTLDINAQYEPDVVGDFRALPFKQDSFDVIAFDPPHLPVAIASPGSSGIWREQYGLTDDVDRGRDGDNVEGQFLPFAHEAARVLRPNGIVVAKLADIVHNHRYQWHTVAFVESCREAGLTPCDQLIKRDPCGGNLKSGRWKSIRHLKRVHSTFIVARLGRCEAPLARAAA